MSNYRRARRRTRKPQSRTKPYRLLQPLSYASRTKYRAIRATASTAAKLLTLRDVHLAEFHPHATTLNITLAILSNQSASAAIRVSKMSDRQLNRHFIATGRSPLDSTTVGAVRFCERMLDGTSVNTAVDELHSLHLRKMEIDAKDANFKPEFLATLPDDAIDMIFGDLLFGHMADDIVSAMSTSADTSADITILSRMLGDAVAVAGVCHGFRRLVLRTGYVQKLFSNFRIQSVWGDLTLKLPAPSPYTSGDTVSHAVAKMMYIDANINRAADTIAMVAGMPCTMLADEPATIPFPDFICKMLTSKCPVRSSAAEYLPHRRAVPTRGMAGVIVADLITQYEWPDTHNHVGGTRFDPGMLVNGSAAPYSGLVSLMAAFRFDVIFLLDAVHEAYTYYDRRTQRRIFALQVADAVDDRQPTTAPVDRDDVHEFLKRVHVPHQWSQSYVRRYARKFVKQQKSNK